MTMATTIPTTTITKTPTKGKQRIEVPTQITGSYSTSSGDPSRERDS